MKTVLAALLLMTAACSGDGPAACVAAGGQCLIGSNPCPNRGSQDCNPDRNPGGAFCCLPCPNGTQSNDAGTICE